jgi:hypothetical protein
VRSGRGTGARVDRPAVAAIVGPVLVVGDVVAPDGCAAVVADLHQRDVAHDVVGGGAVPVALVGGDEDPITGTDHFHRATPSLHEADAMGDPERRPLRTGVSGRPRSRKI